MTTKQDFGHGSFRFRSPPRHPDPLTSAWEPSNRRTRLPPPALIQGLSRQSSPKLSRTTILHPRCFRGAIGRSIQKRNKQNIQFCIKNAYSRDGEYLYYSTVSIACHANMDFLSTASRFKVTNPPEARTPHRT